jgi:transketolase
VWSVTTMTYDDLPGLLTRLTGDEKHDASSFSTLDVVWVLFDSVLGPDDAFLLSKGHGPAAFYAVLAAKGLVPVAELDRFGTFDSTLGYHPDRVLVPAAGIGSGSLGHGLAIGVGRALAGRRTFVLLGDGELDEGSNWEAVQYAGRVGLDRLTTVVVDNASSTHHWPGGIGARFELEGWNATRVDGRDRDGLARELSRRTPGRPHCVVAEVRT